MRRPGSPLFGFSILTTSAPSQARASVQVGPASNWVRSTTRTPFRQLSGAKFPLILCVSSIAAVCRRLIGKNTAEGHDTEIADFREKRIALIGDCVRRAARAKRPAPGKQKAPAWGIDRGFLPQPAPRWG